MAGDDGRVRVVVLGAGAGSMAAVFELTATPELRSKYAVTVYQQGWRLGGKGASGRNAATGQRIEEHGLHAFLGFYENAFRVMRRCYAEWTKAPDNPFQSWTDAFKPQRLITLEERIESGGATHWEAWNIDMPPLPGEPGDGTAPPNLLAWLEKLMAWLMDQARQASSLTAPVAAEHHSLLSSAIDLVRRLAPNVASHTPADHGPVLSHIARAREWARQHVLPRAANDAILRRLWILLDLGYAVATGFLADVLPPWSQGFDGINDEELRAWLVRHGATAANASSAPVNALYSLGFAFVGGDVSNPANAQIAAGVGLKVLLLLLLGYKDAPLWKMQAGMGDTIFSPLYEVLRARGVEFRFFHRVQVLGLSNDGTRVERIELSRQADLKAARYEPLVTVKGLPCWPSAPLWAQLRDGQALEKRRVNFESAWCLDETTRVELRDKRDFDVVLLGMSVAALKDTTAALASADPRWRDMLAQTQTVMTQGVQLWLTPTLAGLGWPAGTTIMTAYAEPLDSWGEMSHLIAREDFPATHPVGSVEYFCGALEDPAVIPPYTDAGFPDTQHARVRDGARVWLERNVGHLWPRAVQPRDPDALDWDTLVDVHDGVGLARLDAQYFRANIDPTERYVLSVPGSIRYRLTAGGSGFANVYLAGDWVRTSINAGSAEAAFESGRRAARAISGAAIDIARDDDVPGP